MRRCRLLLLLTCVVFCALPGAVAHAIVGGDDGDIADWPFLVGLASHERSDDFQGQFCGGSVIAPKAVLTAAHCLDGRSVDVLAGKTTLSAPGGQTVAVLEQRLPPGYDAARNEPDLAVLVLAQPLSVPPVAVAGPADAALTKPGTPLASAGWGVVEQRPRELFADDLQTAALRALPAAPCRNAYGSIWIERTMLCAAASGGRPDTCQGDSGGPLVGTGSDRVVRLVAVVSFGGDRCGVPRWPGVYARTAPYARWIASEAARSAIAAPDPVAERELSAAERRAIHLRFGKMACRSTTRCFVDVRTRGPVERLGGDLVVRVRRGGRHPVDRLAIAHRVRSGHWRAWTNLPWGDVRLTAFGTDAEGAKITRAASTEISVTPG